MGMLNVSDHQMIRRRRVGRGRRQPSKAVSSTEWHWQLMRCDRDYERSMTRQMNVRDRSDRSPLHLKGGHVTAASGQGQEKVSGSPACT